MLIVMMPGFETLILDYPCLWDPLNSHYKDITIRRRCKTELFHKCNQFSPVVLTESEIALKIKAFARKCSRRLTKQQKLNSVTTKGAGDPAVKKTAWKQLTEEYNSSETNSTRKAAELKKCRNNLKIEQKQALALEKREGMKIGRGYYQPPSSTSTSQGSRETLDEALLEATDIELLYVEDSDSIAHEVDLPKSEVMQVKPTLSLFENVEFQADRTGTGITSEVPTKINVTSGAQTERVRDRSIDSRSESRVSDYAAPQTRIEDDKNIRAQVITEEFGLRREDYKRARERDEELHKLKVAEAKELCHKAQIERESAEVVLRCNRTKLEKAELELRLLKNSVIEE